MMNAWYVVYHTTNSNAQRCIEKEILIHDKMSYCKMSRRYDITYSLNNLIVVGFRALAALWDLLITKILLNNAWQYFHRLSEALYAVRHREWWVCDVTGNEDSRAGQWCLSHGETTRRGLSVLTRTRYFSWCLIFDDRNGIPHLMAYFVSEIRWWLRMDILSFNF